MTPSPSRSASPRRTSLLLLLLAAVLALAGCGGSSSTGSTSAARPSGLATIAESVLPAQARDVIKRIDDGGTFQFRQDGVTFQNRERRLPAEPSGYYREYTVATPGAADRGARRLILGREGELYYTPDHYRSFLRVLRGGTT